MPPKTERQRRAMHAAASGKSTIGIPRKVAREFVSKDKSGKLPARSQKHKRGKK